MSTMTDSMAMASKLLVVMDERRKERPRLPDVITPEWLEERLHQFATSLQFEVAAVVDTVIKHRLTQGMVPAKEQRSATPDLLTTEEAASYLHKSTSWLLKRHDIPYIKGIPNHYRKQDLDAWLQRNRFKPRVA